MSCVPAEIPRSFNQCDRQTVLRIGAILTQCADKGLVDIRKVNRILDFGAGFGIPTWLLKQAAGRDSEVTAVEHDAAKAAQLTAHGILKPDHVKVEDGIHYLESASVSGRNFDLITLFSPWPDPDRRFLPTFIDAARTALDASGTILINTAFRTSDAVRKICEEDGMPYSVVSGTIPSSAQCTTPIPLYDTFLIPK